MDPDDRDVRHKADEAAADVRGTAAAVREDPRRIRRLSNWFTGAAGTLLVLWVLARRSGRL